MKNNCIILTHQFILPEKINSRKYGFHTSHGEKWKIKVFDFCVSHFKKNNPDAMIIITGHGIQPPQEILNKADRVYWSPEIIDGEIGAGHPFLVSEGLKIAKEEGMTHVCKTRLDTVNLIEDICSFCHNFIIEDEKEVLNTFYSKTHYLLMDLFNYGKIETLQKMYDPENWRVWWSPSGTASLAKKYINNVLGKEVTFPFNRKVWEKMVNQKIKFVNTETIKWINLRKHNQLIGNKEKEELIMNNDFLNLKEFVWRH